MKEFWNNRYQAKEYAYGKSPNTFFKNRIDCLKPGKILMAAEGEGRNAVYAASLGWEVFAYDFSEVAQAKAIALANEQQVLINYQICSLADLDFPKAYFDAIGLIFVHFPDHVRRKNHQQLINYLKPGGQVILEGFSTNHPKYQKLNPSVGGPKMYEQLYDIEKIKSDFISFKFSILSEEEIYLNEGLYHVGQTKVIRMQGERII
jgi:SAM-dependent methyltransferase